MSLSSVILEQREKEAKALKSFLLYSLIFSLALHIGVLSLGIGKFIQRLSQTKDQPIEITFIETVPKIIAKPQEIKNSQPKINSASGGSRGGGNNNFKSSIPAKTTFSVSNAVIQPVVKQTQLKTTQNFVVKQPQTLTIPETTTTQPTLTTTPIEKITEKLETQTTTQPTAEQPEQTVIPDTKLSDVALPKLTTPSSVSVSSNNTSTTSPSKNSLSNLGNRLRSGLSKATENGTGNGEGSGSGNSIGNSIGNGIGNGTGNSAGKGTGNGEGNKVENKPQTEDKPVAIAPKPRPVNGAKLNRADCIRCTIKYPDRARRRGIEGRAEVALDTDNNGNIIFVQLISSSGDSELDEAAQQAVQEWKLTPLDGGRQGVRASINFAIQGSQRHRQIKERQREKQRETSQIKPKITNDRDSTSSLESVKSDTENQVDETKKQEVAPPDSTSPESNSDAENSN
jgi:TonB family protein